MKNAAEMKTATWQRKALKRVKKNSIPALIIPSRLNQLFGLALYAAQNIFIVSAPLPNHSG